MDEQKVVRPGVKKYRYSPKPGPVPRIPLPPLGGLNVLGAIGFAASAFFNYKLMLQQDAERRQQEIMN
jgi:hypothetical protein